MHSARISLLLLTAVVIGCEKPSSVAPSPSPAAPPPTTLEVPLTLTVKQRSTTTIPGSNDELTLTIDDITRGQVMVSLFDQQGAAIAGPISVAPDDTVPFQYGDADYVLRLTELANALVGDDFATFVIEALGPDESIDDPLTEAQKIERLILAVETLDDATFIRNGTSHTAKGAAGHLRRKLQSANDQIQTATDFIEQIASKSSLTGEEYLIQTDDGRTIKAGDFLRQELAKLAQTKSPDRLHNAVDAK